LWVLRLIFPKAGVCFGDFLAIERVGMVMMHVIFFGGPARRR